MFEKLLSLCKIAEQDKATRYQKDCFASDWENKNASILYQLYHGLMNVVYVEGESELNDDKIKTKWSAVCGYSFHNEILFAPRRVYVVQEARRNIIISKYALPYIEREATTLGIKFIVTSFNDNPRGKVHFNIYKNRKFLKFKTKSDYMSDFIPISDNPLIIMGTPQYAIYKSLTGEVLTIEKTELLLRPN